MLNLVCSFYGSVLVSQSGIGKHVLNSVGQMAITSLLKHHWIICLWICLWKLLDNHYMYFAYLYFAYFFRFSIVFLGCASPYKLFSSHDIEFLVVESIAVLCCVCNNAWIVLIYSIRSHFLTNYMLDASRNCIWGLVSLCLETKAPHYQKTKANLCRPKILGPSLCY